jgi:hypothetical protein
MEMYEILSFPGVRIDTTENRLSLLNENGHATTCLLFATDNPASMGAGIPEISIVRDNHDCHGEIWKRREWRSTLHRRRFIEVCSTLVILYRRGQCARIPKQNK